MFNMTIVIDACSAILLSKAGVLEIFSKWRSVLITKQAYSEVIEGKEKKFEDALTVERLCNEKTIKKVGINSIKLLDKIKNDFGFGDGESASIVYALENKLAVLTDNKQARKAARVYGLKLIGSPEVIVSLLKADKMG